MLGLHQERRIGTLPSFFARLLLLHSVPTEWSVRYFVSDPPVTCVHCMTGQKSLICWPVTSPLALSFSSRALPLFASGADGTRQAHQLLCYRSVISAQNCSAAVGGRFFFLMPAGPFSGHIVPTSYTPDRASALHSTAPPFRTGGITTDRTRRLSASYTRLHRARKAAFPSAGSRHS